MVLDGQEAWDWLLRTAPRRMPSRTVLTENICRCVQQILQHFTTKLPFLTTLTITFSCLASVAPQGDSPTFHDKFALSNNLNNNLFLPGFSSSPGWLLVTRTRGAWWCRYRGHWRSGPRHLTPRSRVCAQEWHRKGIHSHIHSHTHSMHTTIKKIKTR